MLAYIPYMDPMGNVYGLMNPFLMNLHQTIPINPRPSPAFFCGVPRTHTGCLWRSWASFPVRPMVSPG